MFALLRWQLRQSSTRNSLVGQSQWLCHTCCWPLLSSLGELAISIYLPLRRILSLWLIFFRVFSLLTCVCVLSIFAVIQKRRTPVCQFASPLDVDIHSNPQVSNNCQVNVVLNKWEMCSVSQVIDLTTFDEKNKIKALS